MHLCTLPDMQVELRVAARQLSRRGLRASCRFVAELLVGAAPAGGASAVAVALSSSSAVARAGASAAADAADAQAEEAPAFTLARAVFDCREYARAAAVLDRAYASSGFSGSGDETSSSTPAATAAALAAPAYPPLPFFLRCYALYLDGVRQASAERAERPPGATAAANPHLVDLELILAERARVTSLDAFALYV